jgi:hypothetical protein
MPSVAAAEKPPATRSSSLLRSYSYVLDAAAYASEEERLGFNLIISVKILAYVSSSVILFFCLYAD